MRVTSILVAAGLALFANAQSSTSGNAPSSTVDAAQAAQSSAQAEMLQCIEKCNAGDVTCTSKCIAVPSPNDAQVNATNTCVAACPKGNGTETDIANYGNCVQGCIAQNYYTSSVGTPQPTGGSGNSGSSNNNGGGSSSSGGSNSNGGAASTGTSNNQASGTATRAASTSSSTGAAAAATAGLMGVGSAVVGAAGFVAAVMAL